MTEISDELTSQGPNLSGTFLREGEITYRFRPSSINEPAPLLLMLHGRGANEGDIFELVPFVDKRVLVVAPRGPEIYVDTPRGAFMWFPSLGGAVAAEGHFDKSSQYLLKLLDELTGNFRIDTCQIFIGGFSQGAMMSFAMSLLYPGLVSGVIAHSGYIPHSAQLKARLNLVKDKPYFIAHGVRDEMIDIKLARESVAQLNNTGAEVEYNEYSFAHETDLTSRKDLANWLENRLTF